MKPVHIPCANLGPDEPHAASTALPDGIIEKQDFDLLYPGVETELEVFLSSELPPHPKLYRGKLKNGLRYLILPNKVPPNRYSSSMFDGFEFRVLMVDKLLYCNTKIEVIYSSHINLIYRYLKSGGCLENWDSSILYQIKSDIFTKNEGKESVKAVCS